MKFLWWALIALSVVAIVWVWSAWSGPCLGTGEQMKCDLEPNTGWAVALGVTAVAAAAMAFSAIMLWTGSKKPDPTADAR